MWRPASLSLTDHVMYPDPPSSYSGSCQDIVIIAAKLTCFFFFLAHKCFISALLKTLYGHRPQSLFIDMSWIGVEKMPSRKKYSSHKVCSNYESFIKGQYCNLVATLKILAHIYRFKQNVQLHESRILPLHAQSYPLCGALFHSCFW